MRARIAGETTVKLFGHNVGFIGLQNVASDHSMEDMVDLFAKRLTKEQQANIFPFFAMDATLGIGAIKGDVDSSVEEIAMRGQMAPIAKGLTTAGFPQDGVAIATDM